MSGPKFTPGPWKPSRAHEDFEGPMFDIDEEDAATYAARPFVRIEAATCDVASANDLFEFNAADAYLIAAAPELYEAVAMLVEWWDREEAGPQYSAGRDGPNGEAEQSAWFYGNVSLAGETHKLARAALAKARGEAA